MERFEQYVVQSRKPDEKFWLDINPAYYGTPYIMEAVEEAREAVEKASGKHPEKEYRIVRRVREEEVVA